MIYLAADKHGHRVSTYVKSYLQKTEMSYKNIGVRSEKEEMELTTMIPPVVEKVLSDENNKGILICGTGIGVEVGANKFSGIRACLATSPQIAEWATVYDKCNIICLVGWNEEQENVFAILDAWLNTAYDGARARLKMFETFNTWH